MSVVRKALSELQPAERPQVLVVWTPAMEGDGPAAAARARRELEGAGVQHFWDAGGALGRAWAPVLGVPARGSEPARAWDAYLVFGAGPRWGESPPKPGAWLHQLDALPAGLAPRLDADRMRDAMKAAAAR